jgi:hypothetical protein
MGTLRFASPFLFRENLARRQSKNQPFCESITSALTTPDALSQWIRKAAEHQRTKEEKS